MTRKTRVTLICVKSFLTELFRATDSETEHFKEIDDLLNEVETALKEDKVDWDKEKKE